MDIKVFEAFSGYGSQMMALKRLEKENPSLHFVSVGISEIEENPIKAYNAVHGETKNYGDISKINWNDVPSIDLFTYSFPCQDISTMGNQKGLKEGDNTRSGLLWECRKAIISKKPKYLLMENVKQLVSKKFIGDFEKWLEFLDSQGYKSFYKVMNAKNYGVAQNRERVICVSILDDNANFKFPTAIPLTTCIADYLDNPIDESSYYSMEYLNNFHYYDLGCKRYSNSDIIKIGNVFPSNHNAGAVLSINGCSSTILLNHGTGILVEMPNGRIKKLSTREMFRLMGVSNEDIEKMINAVGKTGCMKLAGNSIVVDVLYHTFKSLFL